MAVGYILHTLADLYKINCDCNEVIYPHAALPLFLFITGYMTENSRVRRLSAPKPKTMATARDFTVSGDLGYIYIYFSTRYHGALEPDDKLLTVW